VEEIRELGRVPEKKVVHRHYGSREIGNPVDKKSMQFEIAKSETLNGGKCHLWSQLSA